MLTLFVVLLLAGFAPGSGTAHAAEPVLTLSIGPEVRRFTAAQLLDRPDAAELWENPERSAVGSEQWPYQLASLTEVESPAHRWPQMVVDASLPGDAPARRGQQFSRPSACPAIA
jgi:hypothetical protein